MTAQRGPAAHANDRSVRRRLKVGYVSPDFRHHSVAFFARKIESAYRAIWQRWCASSQLP
jgi:predicted O-linked N-acetylglucosamine transferase (SPINDLY family)